MSYNNGVISGNVTVPDLRTALGTTYTDVVMLCTHPNIRKYSRYKPYAFGGILPNGLYGGVEPYAGNEVSDAIIKENNFGMSPTEINFPSGTTLAGVVTAWGQWRPPSGKRKVDAPSQKEDEPCRMGDFRGYDRNAVPYLESYEIFGDISDNFFYPIRNGMMGVRLTINSKTGTSILPSEFTYNGVSFDDMRLTILIANLDQRGRFLYVQSQRTMLDASIESFWNTATKKGTLEVRMDLTTAEDDDINTFLNGGTNLFMAVGLAEEVDLKYNWDVLTDVGNATYINVKSIERKMPFPLVNFNMWGENWKIAGVYGGFAINANREARFFLPCNLIAYPDYTSCSYNKSTKTISISFGSGTKFTIQPFFDYASVISTGKYASTKTDIADFRNGGWLGLSFDVEVSKDGSVLYDKKYIVIAPSKAETTTTSDDRIITIGTGGITLNPASNKTSQQIASDKQIFEAWFGAEYVPSNGVIQIPYDGTKGSVKVKMNCSIVCFPYRDVNIKWVYAVPVAQFTNNVIEKLLVNTSVG